jgi:hypothetical protein
MEKCDEVRPRCGNCSKRNHDCPGYRDLFDAVHKHYNIASTERKLAVSKSSPEASSTLSDDLNPRLLTTLSSQETPESDAGFQDVLDLPLVISPCRNLEIESNYWFFQNYVTVPRDPSTNIFIEHILPLYTKVSVESPLSHTVNAVALEIMQMWFSRRTDSHLAQKYYGRAMTLLTEALQDPVESKSDETLATVFMFDFYDSLRKRFAGYVDSGAHQQGESHSCDTEARKTSRVQHPSDYFRR